MFDLRTTKVGDKQEPYALGSNRDDVLEMFNNSETVRSIFDAVPAGTIIELRRMSEGERTKLANVIVSSEGTGSASVRTEIARHIAEFGKITHDGGKPFSSAKEMLEFLPWPLVVDIQVQLLKQTSVDVGND